MVSHLIAYSCRIKDRCHILRPANPLLSISFDEELFATKFIRRLAILQCLLATLHSIPRHPLASLHNRRTILYLSIYSL